MSAPEPVLGDVIARLEALDRAVTAMDRTLSLEMRALRAELTLALTSLGQDVRDLWTEHMAHSHPNEEP